MSSLRQNVRDMGLKSSLTTTFAKYIKGIPNSFSTFVTLVPFVLKGSCLNLSIAQLKFLLSAFVERRINNRGRAANIRPRVC